MVTIKDVAARAGVSFKTVSRVLNDAPGVTDRTRERVLRTADELGYRSNFSARRLVTGRANAVGVVIPESAQYVFTHLYFNEILRGIGEVLDQHGLDLMLHLGKSRSPYSDLVRHQKVDGLVLLSIATDDPHYPELISSGIPCVFTSRVVAENNPTNWFDSNAAQGIALAVEHLVARGHTRMGMLAGPANMVLAQEQLAAFREVLAEHGQGVTESWVRRVAHTVESGEEQAMEVLSAPARPTALICADDMSAIGAIRAASRFDLRVPDDLSVTGFDDVILARYSMPPLTTIRQDAHRKGRLAAGHLVKLLEGKSQEAPWQCLLDTDLIIRGSTGPASGSTSTHRERNAAT